MESKPLNIAICPPENISAIAVKISKKFKKNGGLFVLDDKNYFSHITIYTAEFPVKNIQKIKKALRELAAKTKSFYAAALKYRYDKDGYIDINYRKSQQIKRLQEKIIALLNPLREGLLRPKDKVRLGRLDKARRRNIRLYGYRSVDRQFFPHLTFTKLEKFDKSAFLNIDQMDFSFTVDKIGLFSLGDYGTCRKLIEIFDF